MNTCPILSATLAASVVFAPALVSAQAPQSPTNQTPQAKIESLQAQVDTLQAQVKRLQAQVRASSSSGVISPFYKVPNIETPNYKIDPFQSPRIFQNPGGPGFGGQGNFGMPNNTLPRVVPQPHSRDNSIPDYTATFITQTPR